MIALEPPLRLATADDAAALADLVNFAGEGLPLHLWTGLARDGQDPWEIGRARQAEKARDGRIVVMDAGDGAVASLTGYAIGAQPVPIDADFPPLLRPLQELENRALDTWYVNVLACYPQHRGQGIGSRLLDVAERIARSEGKPRMSVIVASDNAGARRLYERHDYVETDSRECIKDGWATQAERWILLLKRLP
ncbi:GNAT family N-acetyltransferase [Pararhodobacter sp. SW119]|uniref:GNAT family N-acetyltransferase n=1 Tax=Pararhodobacter sp. SW119 TaxID=2780075 RepID=UPI001AE0AA74|nr:GNAT family N-acetyltransferase [Pararhodobacter sp. SW119]